MNWIKILELNLKAFKSIAKDFKTIDVIEDNTLRLTSKMLDDRYKTNFTELRERLLIWGELSKRDLEEYQNDLETIKIIENGQQASL